METLPFVAIGGCVYLIMGKTGESIHAARKYGTSTMN
jgi:hypothetical protein